MPLIFFGWIGLFGALCLHQSHVEGHSVHGQQHCNLAGHVGGHLDELHAYMYVYDSMLALSPDLQSSCALVVVSIIIGIAGLLAASAGGKCTNFIPEERAKDRASVTGVVLLIIIGLLCTIDVSWTASITIRDFYKPMVVDA